MKLVEAFTKATGVPVTVINEGLDDVQPKASVAANTNQGPDIFWAFIRSRISSRPSAWT